jgi:hypothetical protein
MQDVEWYSDGREDQTQWASPSAVCPLADRPKALSPMPTAVPLEKYKGTTDWGND